jgi:hypothetical protein
MELSRINIENRERIKKVLGLNDSSLVKMHENDLLNELLDTIVFFDDDEKNKFIPRIQDLSDELTQLKQKVVGLEQKVIEVNKSSHSRASEKIEKKEDKKEKEIAAATNNSNPDDHEDAHEIYEKNKKQIANFLKKKLSVIDNGDLESIHPKHKDLEEEVLRLAKENGELNSIIIEDMDLIDSLMLELKNHKIEWKHTMIDKRAQKIKSFNAGYQPFGRLFIYKKLLSIPKLELEKEKTPSN